MGTCETALGRLVEVLDISYMFAGSPLQKKCHVYDFFNCISLKYGLPILSLKITVWDLYNMNRKLFSCLYESRKSDQKKAPQDQTATARVSCGQES